MSKIAALFLHLKLLNVASLFSLSNFALLVLIIKIAISSSLEWPLIAALFVVFLDRNTMMWFRKAKTDSESAKASAIAQDNEELKAFRRELSALTQVVNLKSRL